MGVNSRCDKFSDRLKERKRGTIADEYYQVTSVPDTAGHSVRHTATEDGRGKWFVLSFPCASYKSLASRGTSVSSSAEASL